MSLTAAASGFVIFLLCLPVVQSQYGWGVTYTSTQICAVKGSTVEIRCTYKHPHLYWKTGTKIIKVEKTFWFTRTNGVDLTTKEEYAGRVQHSCHQKSCTLRITDLRESDSATYKFRFITNKPDGSYTGEPGVTLSVTDDSLIVLQVQVTRISVSQNYIYVQLKCHSSCSPPGQHSYIWFKNGEKNDQRTSSYEDQIYSTDKISCAVHPYEQHRSAAVYAPDSVSASVSPSGEIVEGTSVTLTCSSDANPAASYTWYKKNRNPNQAVSTGAQLTFSSIQRSDSGKYYCEAENELGRRRSVIKMINVKYAPDSVSASVSPSGEIVEGTSVTLTCSSDAKPAASYTWYEKNRNPNQPVSTGAQLTFSSIQRSDSGEYYCEAENELGRRRSLIKIINVKYAPKLPSASVSRSAVMMEGTSVTLTCSSDANPAASYTWYKKNRNPNQAVSTGAQLTFSSIQRSDSGEYYCEARNELGRRSVIKMINVKYSPKLPSVSVSPSGEVVEDTSVTLTCSSDANPAASYTWYNKNRNPNQPVSTGAQLTFSSIQRSDSGEYYCEAKNELGRIRSVYKTINVKYSPKLPSVSVSPSAVMMEGTSVTLTCSSDANPAANYIWYKTNQKRLHGPKGIYVFTSINVNDSGIYYCQSENKYGRINSSTVLIDVQYAPKPPSVSVSPPGEIEEGTSVTLTCSSDANPAANYTWYKEDEASPKASGEIFMMVNITSEHGGNYYCEAWNSWGHQNSTLHLSVASRSLKLVAAAGSITVILLVVIISSAFIFIRRKRSSEQTAESRERPDNEAEPDAAHEYENLSAVGFRRQAEEEDDVQYSSTRFHQSQEDPLYSIISKPKRQKDVKEEEDVVYSLVEFSNHKPK